MKYKVLKSVCHNFSHSFVSYGNYVDDGFVIDDLRDLARKASGDRIAIIWIPDEKQPGELTPRVLKSIAFWKADLSRFVESAGSSLSAISAFKTEIYLKSNKQLAVDGTLVDDRGRIYKTQIYDF